MVVAIDGPAGVGKSTVCKRIAASTGLFYLNSGNFYRAVTLAVLQSGGDPEDPATVLETAKRSKIVLVNDRIILNGTDVEELLHSRDVDAWVAQHSAIVEVRRVVNGLLRETAQTRDLIAEGRDMTTVVFPDADLKVYLDADLSVRARRRYLQGTSGSSESEAMENLRMRDSIDTNKEEGSLVIAPDAVYLDTSDLTIDEVCDKVVAEIRVSH